MRLEIWRRMTGTGILEWGKDDSDGDSDGDGDYWDSSFIDYANQVLENP